MWLLAHGAMVGFVDVVLCVFLKLASRMFEESWTVLEDCGNKHVVRQLQTAIARKGLGFRGKVIHAHTHIIIYIITTILIAILISLPPNFLGVLVLGGI